MTADSTPSDLDRRITAALSDAAESTPVSNDALGQVLRRAESSRAHRPARRLTLLAASVAVATVGGTGVLLLRPGHSAAPASDQTSAVATAPPTLPEAGFVDGPQVYDDATLLAMLYVGFDAGEPEDASRMFSGYADNELLATCMQKAGYQYDAAPSQTETQATDPRYTLAPSEFAAEYGLGVAAEALGLLAAEYQVDPNWEFRSTLSASQQEAFDDAESACLTEQIDNGDVVVNDQAWGNAVDYSWQQFQPIVESDDRVVEALAAWQQCMAASGYDYDDPAAVVVDFRSRLSGLGVPGQTFDPDSPEYAEAQQLMAAEIAVATANAECIPPYTEALRAAIVDHFDEYKQIFLSALDTGVDSDAVG